MNEQTPEDILERIEWLYGIELTDMQRNHVLENYYANMSDEETKELLKGKTIQ